MATKRSTLIFLLILAAVASYFCFVLAGPFLSSIAWALVIAVMFFPVHTRIQRKVPNPNLAATVSIALVVLIFMIPAVLLGRAMAIDLASLYRHASNQTLLDGGWPVQLSHWNDSASGWINRHFGTTEIDLRREATARLEELSATLGSSIAGWLGNALSLLAGCIVTLFILFFIFRDGVALRDRLGLLLPLTHEQVERLFRSVSDTIFAEMYGVLAVAIGHGILLGLAVWLLNLPSPVLWAALTAVASLVPVGGTALVWLPGSIILILTGHWVKGLILLVWGGAFVSVLSSIVQPLVIGRRVKIHPLEIFVGLLGGVQVFGLIGLFAGPIIISLTLALFDILKEEVRSWRSTEAEGQEGQTPDDASVVLEAIIPSPPD
ncbi:MAG TPA: AI-2E family transporter [Blastocatellia bacterium]